jgi:hypothetical protein
MLEWIRIRDEVTCEVYYDLYDHNIQNTVVTIREVSKRYKVRILDHVPFHTSKLKIAKEAGQHIYEQTCVKQLAC